MARVSSSAVERISGPRGQQRTVPAQARSTAQDRADIGVIDDVFQHHQPPQPQQICDLMPGLPMQGCQRSPVHMKAGHLLGQFLGHHINRDLRMHLEHIGQRLQPPLGQQERPRKKAGLNGPPDDLLPFGDEISIPENIPTEWLFVSRPSAHRSRR